MTISLRDPVRSIREAVVPPVLLDDLAALLDVHHLEAVVHSGHQELVPAPGSQSPHPTPHVPCVQLTLEAPRVPEAHVLVIAAGQKRNIVPKIKENKKEGETGLRIKLTVAKY